jgi:hypothetical protein
MADPADGDVEKAVPGTNHTVTINGIRMHYVLAGQGPPVVLARLPRNVVQMADSSMRADRFRHLLDHTGPLASIYFDDSHKPKMRQRN